MNVLQSVPATINIHGDMDKVIQMFLRIYLANERLTDKQLQVTGQLVAKYSKYVADNVKEPYASELLFSTNSRKEICDALGISVAHLNNTFNALTKKNILAKEENAGYVINPNIVPRKTLIFEFKLTGANKG